MNNQTIKDLLIYMDLQILSNKDKLNVASFFAMINLDTKYNGQLSDDEQMHKLICDAIEYLNKKSESDLDVEDKE